MTPASTPHIKDYLLGRLNVEDEARLEQRYFADAECVDEIWAVFAELSEQYLCGELTAAERAEFETRLRSSPALREMFENEKALFGYAPAVLPEAAQIPFASTPQSPKLHSGFFRRLTIKPLNPLRLAVLGAGLLLLVGLWFVRQAWKTPANDSDTTAIERNDATPAPTPLLLPSPTPSSTPRGSQAVVATFFLPVQALRAGAEAVVLNLPAQTQTLRLELELMSGDFARYSATLQSGSAESAGTLREWKSLSPQRRASFDKIVLRLPAALLTESSYLIKLKPMDGAGSDAFEQQFRFTVAKR